MIRALRWGWALGVAVAAGAQEVVELPWRTDAQGRWEVRMLGDSTGQKAVQFGDWMPVFEGLFQVFDGQYGIVHRFEERPLDLVPLLIHGHGGAAAIPDATRRLRRLSLGVTIDWWTLEELARDPLVDLLRVRHLESSDAQIATLGLYRYAEDEQRDPFVRAAARAALRARGEKGTELAAMLAADVDLRRHGASALHAGLERMPNDVDVVLGVHGARLDSAAPLLAAWRQFMAYQSSSLVAAAGGNVSPARRHAWLVSADTPAQLPYELAVQFGNFRVDFALLAARVEKHAHWWAHLGGRFQPRLFEQGIEGAGGVARRDESGAVNGSLCGCEIVVTDTALEIWSQDLDVGPRGAWGQHLHARAGTDEAPIWLHLPKASRIGPRIGAAGAEVDVRFRVAPRSLVIDARCPDADAADSLYANVIGWQKARRYEPEGVAIEGFGTTWGEIEQRGRRDPFWWTLVYRRLAQSIDVKRDGPRVRLDLDLAPYPLVDLVPALGSNPIEILEDR